MFFLCENQIYSYYPRKKNLISLKKNDITKILSKTAQIWPKMMLSIIVSFYLKIQGFFNNGLAHGAYREI